MVTLSPGEAYLFLNGALLGVGVGIIGNWIVNALFRLVPKTRRWNFALLGIGLAMLATLLILIVPFIEYLKSFP